MRLPYGKLSALSPECAEKVNLFSRFLLFHPDDDDVFLFHLAVNKVEELRGSCQDTTGLSLATRYVNVPELTDVRSLVRFRFDFSSEQDNPFTICSVVFAKVAHTSNMKSRRV